MTVVSILATVKRENVDRVRRKVDCVELPGCMTGYASIDELLFSGDEVQIRLSVRLYVVFGKRCDKIKMLEEKMVAICNNL